MTPFDVASSAIIATGKCSANTKELEALLELVQIQISEIDPNYSIFDYIKFEQMLKKRFEELGVRIERTIEDIKTDILDCMTFFKESSPRAQDQ